MGNKELTVPRGALYMLRWETPDTPVKNSFMNPHDPPIEFLDPDPTPADKTAEPVQIKVEREKPTGLEQDRFFKNRTAPFVAKKTKATARGQLPIKEFSAVFKARTEGVFVFTVTPAQGDPITTRVTVTPPPARKVYRTIQDVLDDPNNVRRHAVLANAANFLPAANAESGLAVGTESGHIGNGPYVGTYSFPPATNGTSCVTVNPIIAVRGLTKNNSAKWAFNAGPAHEEGPNPAWVVCDKDHLPNVGDTYITLNGYTFGYGHVGVVLHVPPSGNGLWVTGDGGQSQKPEQLGLIIPRWGLMGAMLPLKGGPKKPYPQMKPEDNGGAFLSGMGKADINEDPDPTKDTPVPAQNDDIAGMIRRMIFRPTADIAFTSSPRRLEGYVDVDNDQALKFDLDGQAVTTAMTDAIKKLQARVQNVIDACLAGEIIKAKGT